MPTTKKKPLPSAGKLIKPAPLKAGDKVGLACPASRPASPTVLQRCVRIVEEMGFKPIVGHHVFGMHGYMAGSDDERLSDLEQFFLDDSVRAIFFVTGGFGSLHLVPRLPYAYIAAHPKAVIGCDDNTHLLVALLSASGLMTFHGPNLDQISTRHSFDRLKEAVTTRGILKPVSCAEAARDEVGGGPPFSPVAGTASGALIGGNLTAITSLMGTAYRPDFADAVLFLEDMDERNDILDRWFTALHISGQLGRARAIAFGEFAGCGQRGSHDLLSLEELFEARLKQIGKPCCFNLPVGQGNMAATVPLGVEARLNASEGVLEFAEPHLA